MSGPVPSRGPAAPGATPGGPAPDAALRLAAGRARAGELAPYLATALFAVTPVRAPGIGTLGVDRRWRLHWDPAFVAALTVAECAGVWLHEVAHLLREHAERWDALAEPDARHRRWNRAADAAINADLREGGVVLPAVHAWFPERVPGGRAGMSAEQLFRLLPDDPDDAVGSGPPDLAAGPDGEVDCGSGAGGRRRAWEPSDDPGPGVVGSPDPGDGSVDAGRAVLLRRQVAEAVSRQVRGAVPGGWVRWAEGVLEPRVDWRSELDATVRRAAAGVAGLRDHTYARPSRRSASVPGAVLPAMRSPRPPVVRVVLDTSGSMGAAALARCLAEVAAIVARTARGGSGVEVLTCDASAADVQVVRETSRLVLVGGGGTDLRVGLAAAAARRPRPDLVVTLTDGLTPWPDAPPPGAPRARHVVVLVDGGEALDRVPAWMHPVVVPAGDDGGGRGGRVRSG